MIPSLTVSSASASTAALGNESMRSSVWSLEVEIQRVRNLTAEQELLEETVTAQPPQL